MGNYCDKLIEFMLHFRKWKVIERLLPRTAWLVLMAIPNLRFATENDFMIPATAASFQEKFSVSIPCNDKNSHLC